MVFETRGNAIVIVLALAIMVGAALLYAMANLLPLQRRPDADNSLVSVKAFKQNLITVLSDDNSWLSTLNDVQNSSLDCIRLGSDCRNIVGGPFGIRNAAGTMFYDGKLANIGVDDSGAVCDTFSVSTGTSKCPFRFELSWRPDCPVTGTCSPPTRIIIDGILIYSPPNDSNTLRPNIEKYKFTVVK